ncbi:MAG: ABC transporter permease [Pirellulales bacterium]|nr:ABC transporter permease [Pirellulales bacterium]
MLSYVIRRLLIGALTLLLITFAIYGLIRFMPGDPTVFALEQMDPGRALNKQEIERMREQFGLNDQVHVAYFKWLSNVARLDLGRSISRKQPVSRLIRERIAPTLTISLTSLVLAYLLSIPLGLYATVRNGKTDERAFSLFLYMLYSFPAFVAALFLQIIFAVKLGWLPLFGMVSDDYAHMSTLDKSWDLFRHALLPVICYTYGGLAMESRFIRSNMMEVMKQDYIRTARAKGVSPLRIVVHHAFRNTLIPFVTLLGLTLPSLLSGSVILEQIFSWPGMGRLFFESIRERDYPTIMGLTLIFSLLTLVAQLLADMLYAIVDPRVRYS